MGNRGQPLAWVIAFWTGVGNQAEIELKRWKDLSSWRRFWRWEMKRIRNLGKRIQLMLGIKGKDGLPILIVDAESGWNDPDSFWARHNLMAKSSSKDGKEETKKEPFDPYHVPEHVFEVEAEYKGYVPESPEPEVPKESSEPVVCSEAKVADSTPQMDEPSAKRRKL